MTRNTRATNRRQVSPATGPANRVSNAVYSAQRSGDVLEFALAHSDEPLLRVQLLEDSNLLLREQNPISEPRALAIEDPSSSPFTPEMESFERLAELVDKLYMLWEEIPDRAKFVKRLHSWYLGELMSMLDPADQHEIAACVEFKYQQNWERWHREFTAGLDQLLAYGAPRIAIQKFQTELEVVYPTGYLQKLVRRDFEDHGELLTFDRWARVSHSITIEMLKQMHLVPRCFSVDEWRDIVAAAVQYVETRPAVDSLITVLPTDATN